MLTIGKWAWHALLWAAIALLIPSFALATALNLTFPIKEGELRGNPYNYLLTAVLDYSGTTFYTTDGSTVAYTGEDSSETNTSFQAHGNYNYPSVLYYDGHSGYDYAPLNGVVAKLTPAASGELIIPAIDPINGKNGAKSPWCGWHTFMIKHENGWSTWYLHNKELTVTIPDKYSRQLDCSDETPQEEDISLGSFDIDDEVAIVGTYAAKGTHLHFEVRKDNKVVDPYGWEWSSLSPIRANNKALALENNPILWKDFKRPTVTSADIRPTDDGPFEITVAGAGFEEGSKISFWDKNGAWRGTISTPDLEGDVLLKASVDPSVMQGDAATSDLSSLFAKVDLPNGPRSFPRAIKEEQAEPDEPARVVEEPTPVVEEPRAHLKCKFDDVEVIDEKGRRHWARSYINHLCSIGILKGDSGGKLAFPQRDTNRGEFVKLLVEALDKQEGGDADLEEPAGDLPFSDINDEHNWFARHLEYALENELIEGYKDGTFRPGSPIARAEAAAVLIRSFKLTTAQEVDSDGESMLGKIANKYQELIAQCNDGKGTCKEIPNEFSDVVNESEDWFYYYVYGVREAGVMTGFGDPEANQFGPLQNLKRSESAKIICLTFFGEDDCE